MIYVQHAVRKTELSTLHYLVAAEFWHI